MRSKGNVMGANEKVTATFHPNEYVCLGCDLIWNSEAAAERCDCGDTTATLSPSKNRVRYDLGYD